MSAQDYHLHPLAEGELELGMDLPWTVYGANGQLLMREGAPVDTQRKLDNLMENGYREKLGKPLSEEEAAADAPPPNEPQPTKFERGTNPFIELDEIAEELDKIFERLDFGQLESNELESKIYTLAAKIQGLVVLNTDAILGAVHLNQQHKYIVTHPLHVTIIAALIAKKLQVPQKIQLSMLAAALTQNVGMNSFQMHLHNQAGPLDKSQRSRVQEHPLKGAKMLSEAGVSDKLWLQTILQHHEKIDGSGYPKGLKGNQIRPEARIIALGDVYSALVTGRSYRPALSAQQSLKSIFLERGKQFDANLSKIFLSELGIYPPGSCVKLKNGEIAIVIKRTSDTRAPKVTSVMDERGNLLMRLQERDTGDPKYAIVANVKNKQLPRLNPTLLWNIRLRRSS